MANYVLDYTGQQVNTKLTKAENIDNKVTSLSSSSTDTEYPSAKVVYDELIIKANTSDVVSKTTTIAGIDLQDNITNSELKTALNVPDLGNGSTDELLKASNTGAIGRSGYTVDANSAHIINTSAAAVKIPTAKAVAEKLADKQDKNPDGSNALIDSNTGKINTTYIPDSLLGQVIFGGIITGREGPSDEVVSLTVTLSATAKSILNTSNTTYNLYPSDSLNYNANTCENMFFISNLSTVDVGFDSFILNTGDWLISLNDAWQKVDNTDSISSVNGKVGNITLKTSDLQNDSGYITAATTLAGYGITDAQKKHSTLTLTLAATDWSNDVITVTATGVTASNTVIVSPAPTSIEEVANSQVYCSAQGSNSLTFSCLNGSPSENITMNVIILNN